MSAEAVASSEITQDANFGQGGLPSPSSSPTKCDPSSIGHDPRVSWIPPNLPSKVQPSIKTKNVISNTCRLGDEESSSCPSCDELPRKRTRPRAFSRGLFFAGFVGGPWLWLIGGWLVESDSEAVRHSKAASWHVKHRKRSPIAQENNAAIGPKDPQGAGALNDEKIGRHSASNNRHAIYVQSPVTSDSSHHPGCKGNGDSANPPALRLTGQLPIIRVQGEDDLTLPSRAIDTELGVLNRSWMNLAFFTAPSSASWLDLTTPYGSGGSGSRLSMSLMEAFPTPPKGVQKTMGREVEFDGVKRRAGLMLLGWLRVRFGGRPYPSAHPPDVESSTTKVPTHEKNVSDRVSPWVWRCRLAAIISTIFVLALCILAIVWAAVGRR